MKLIELDAGNVSLEYRPDEAAAVRRRLGEAGRVRVTKTATYDLLSVGKMSFIAMNDWDDPCLISQTLAGAALLRSIVAPPQDARVAASN